MAPYHSKDSIVISAQKSESIRNITRDYYLQASKLFTNYNIEGVNRYYQIKVNSLVSLEHDDIDYIVRLSKRNVNCIKCGSTKTLHIRNRRARNKSDRRKYCKYLRSLCIQYCDSCQSHYNSFKLLGKKQLQQRKQLCPQGQKPKDIDNRLSNSHTKQTNLDKLVPDKTKIDSNQSAKIPQPKIIANSSTSGSPQHPRTSFRNKETFGKSKPSRPINNNKQPTQPKLEFIPPSKISKTTKPQFSSRLRAFSCLLEE